MDSRPGKSQTPESSAFKSSEYEQGLRVLARIIARIHTQRATKKLEGKDGLFKGDPSP
jgi:hypothetical protein